jgi:hypothetical protein
MNNESALLGLNGIVLANFHQRIDHESKSVKIIIVKYQELQVLAALHDFVKLRLARENMLAFLYHNIIFL